MSEQELGVGAILCADIARQDFASLETKVHVNEMCNANLCKNNNCAKRHPRVCKYFASNNRCKFENRCAYIHPKRENMEHIDMLEREVNNLKLDIAKLTRQTELMAQKVKENYSQNNEINEMKEEFK